LHGKVLLLDHGVVAAGDGDAHEVAQPNIHAAVQEG
jgi:hypothetical protein